MAEAAGITQGTKQSPPPPTNGAQSPGAAPNGAHHPGAGHMGASSTSQSESDGATSMQKKSRSKIPWSKDVWDRIDAAVAQEIKRTRVAGRFLPIRMVPPKTTSVPTDAYRAPGGVYSVDEGLTVRVNEYYVEFNLTPQQVDQEEGDFKQLGHSTAVTLATRAANILAQAEDLIVFQGQNAPALAPIFAGGQVQLLAGNLPSDTGLLSFPVGGAVVAAGAPAPILVAPTAPGVYGSNTFAAVAQAYSQLQAVGHYGPYALVLHTIPYADTFSPLPNTLVITADRIKPLMTAGLFGTGTLPPYARAGVALAPPYYGVMVSTGGNTLDMISGIEPMVAFQQEDTTGNFCFRVLQRFALRIKDPTAIVLLQFN